MTSNLAHRIEDFQTMTPTESDVVLAQWAAWQFDSTQTGYAIGSWQKDWRPNFDPEYADVLSDITKRLGRGEERTMLRVDEALSALGRQSSHSLHVILARYRLGHQLTHKQMQTPLQMFASVFSYMLDNNLFKN